MLVDSECSSVFGEVNELSSSRHVEVAAVHLGQSIVESIVDSCAQGSVVGAGHITPGRVALGVSLRRDVGCEQGHGRGQERGAKHV